MKKNYIITISRQYGSGGREIGRQLAQRLGVPHYDKELINLAAQRSGFAPEHFEEAEQKASKSLLFSLLRAGSAMNSYDLPLNDKVYLIQSKVISQLADEGPCVIVGRCADYILQDRPDCLHFFIHAPLQQRVERAVKVYGLAPDKAEDLVKKIDRRRATYYNYYTSMRFGDAGNYNLSVNSLSLGIENTVSLLERYIELADWK